MLFSIVASASNSNFSSEKEVNKTANVVEASVAFGNFRCAIQHVIFTNGKFLSYETIHYTDAVSDADCSSQAQSHVDRLNGW